MAAAKPATPEDTTPKVEAKHVSVIAGFSKDLAILTQAAEEAASKIGGDVAKRYADAAIRKMKEAISDLANAEAQDG